VQQALEWHNLPPEQVVPSEASPSPEAISYFSPDPNVILPSNYPLPAPSRLPRGPKKSASSRTVSHSSYLAQYGNRADLLAEEADPEPRSTAGVPDPATAAI